MTLIKPIALANNNQLYPKDLGNKEQIEFYLSQLSLEQKISQMLIFGFSGTKYNQSMGPRLRSFSPGGMIVFQRNIQNPWELASMNYEAQKQAIESTGLPLFIMIDQEGGQVTRIKTRPPAPSALALGQTEDESLVKSVGYVTGKILDLTGINVNLAPVMDLSDPKKKSFIGNRSFGDSPEAVTRMTQAFSSGLVDGGVIPAAKHFPGHGGISQDSHKGLTVKSSSESEMMNEDLVPFQAFVKNNPISAVMVAHVAYPKLDESRIPATYSRKIITDLLRDQMGYNGLVITDDLEMLGAAKVGRIEDRAVKAVNAGVDMIMIAWSREKQVRARDALLKAVSEGKISQTRIDDSLRRIIRAKLALKKALDLKQKSFLARKKQLEFYAEELKVLVKKVTRINFDKSTKSFSQLINPIPKDVIPYVFAADVNFYNSFKKTFDGKTAFIPISRKSNGNVYGYLSKDSRRVAVFYATGTLSARIAQKIHPSIRDRVFIVNSNYPGLIHNSPPFAGVIDLNTRDFQSGKWLANFIMAERDRDRGPASKKAYAKKREP